MCEFLPSDTKSPLLTVIFFFILTLNSFGMIHPLFFDKMSKKYSFYKFGKNQRIEQHLG